MSFSFNGRSIIKRTFYDRKKDTISIFKNDNLLCISQKNIANLFLLKYISNTDNIEKTVSGPLIANTVVKEDKLSYLHSLFGHQGIENFKITLQYYGYQYASSQLLSFKCKTCELNNIKHAIIKRKNQVAFPGNDGEFSDMDFVEILTTSRAGTDSFTVTMKNGIRIEKTHSDQGTELYN
eukprot:snap_masked-scaffold_76-processed-gene-0.52-mRNA-1 protein AED:1.00 eAED:1.00 QI:0/0/0/0/1/1/3/0/179